MAFEDPLTGVGNRRVLDDALRELLPEGGPGATVVMCDIDNLKELNDGQGHEAGDRAIKATADAFASAASHLPGAVTVRLGGDEFAVLLVGEQRSAAITLVEQAGRTLAGAQPPVEVSCGVAVVPAGVSARDALTAADAAQYTAKARGALLVVSSDVDPVALDDRDRRRVRRRLADRPRPAAAVAEGVLHLVADLAERLGEPLGPVGARLRWIGERLLVPLGLHEWSLSHVDLAGERLLTTDSLGLRHTPVPAPHAYDLLVDHGFRLDDFPTTARAITDCCWFGVDVDDAAADEQERSVLREMGMRYVVAVGCHDGDDGWLLELFGRDPATDVQLVGGVLATACSALLQRPIVGLSAKMGA
jgi:diguanylate cyclase (GGDEF)-like protein